jgi:hypothetical protein
MNSIESQTKLLLYDIDLENPTSFEELGYIYFGPLLFNFFIWLKNESEGCDKILFNSREGFFLNQIYEPFKNKFDLPTSVYFKTSRKLSSITSFFTKEDIYDTFKLHRYSGKLSELLKDRFGVDVDIKNDITIDTLNEIPNLDSYVDVILKKSNDTRNEYQLYLNEVLGDSKNIVMVDSGYQGTTQHNIQRTFDVQFKGRYLTYKGNIPLNDVKGFYDYYNSNFKDNLIFLESVFIDKIGSYVDIKNGQFLNETQNVNEIYFTEKQKIINGIKQFTNDMLNSEIDTTEVSNKFPDYLFNLMCKPNYIKTNKLFNIFYHDNLYVRSGSKKINRQ